MRKVIVKISVLLILIILCIGQTMVLWLGNLPSHNFFAQEDTYNTLALEPKAIWINLGNNKLTYSIDNFGSEYNENLITELCSTLGEKKIKVENASHISYYDLLRVQGFFYEYSIKFNLSDLKGAAVTKDPSFDEIFLDVSDYGTDKTTIYLINDNKVDYKVTVHASLETHKKVLERYASIDGSFTVEYQASGLTGSYDNISKNVFYPISSQEAPIVYSRISLSPVVDLSSDKYEKQLEHYVNSFFINPLLKESQRTTAGSVIFTEGVKTTVRYSDKGVLEFKKTSTSAGNSLKNWEKLDLVGDFIESCGGISENIKRGIYLKRISEDKEHQTVYSFGYKYNGYEVLLSDALKERLDIDEILELTVKNNEVVQGKWLMFNISTENGEVGKITDSIDTVLDNAYDRFDIANIDYLQCAYVVEGINKVSDVHWSVVYEDEWWYQ